MHRRACRFYAGLLGWCDARSPCLLRTRLAVMRPAAGKLALEQRAEQLSSFLGWLLLLPLVRAWCALHWLPRGGPRELLEQLVVCVVPACYCEPVVGSYRGHVSVLQTGSRQPINIMPQCSGCPTLGGVLVAAFIQAAAVMMPPGPAQQGALALAVLPTGGRLLCSASVSTASADM